MFGSDFNIYSALSRHVHQGIPLSPTLQASHNKEVKGSHSRPHDSIVTAVSQWVRLTARESSSGTTMIHGGGWWLIPPRF